MTWTYLVADLRSNIVIDELPLTNVRMTKILNGSGQMQAQLRLGDPKVQVHNPYNLTRPVRNVIYAVRDHRPWWGGIIWASTYDSASQVIDIGCADFWSYFDHRRVVEALSAPPYALSYVAGLSKIYTQQDQNDIARGLVTLAQTHTAGDIGIDVDSALSGILRDRTYEGYDLYETGEALRDLAGVSDGPDIVFDVGGFDGNGRPTRLMRTGTPALGQQGSGHRWDFGGNMLDYTWDSGGGLMATRSFALGDGTDRGVPIAVAEDTGRYDDGWPLLETDDDFDAVTAATLQEHADTLLDGTSLPVVALSISVLGDRAPALGELSVGDAGAVVIPAGDLDPLFPAGLNLAVRVTSIEVTVPDVGTEGIKLACLPQQEVI